MTEVQLLIADRDTAASNAATFERANPISGSIATRAAAATVDDARGAAAAAAAAFPAWSALGPNERRKKLLRAADLLEAHTQDFIKVMMDEIGSTAGWAGFNVYLAAQMLREAASMTTQVSGETIPSDIPGSLAFSIRQPVGVVLGIAPWNAPVILGVRAVAMPLACGNTVILKASEICPATHRLIGTVLREAGLDHGVINVLTHDPASASAIVEALIADPAVRRVNFTGSTRVGKMIAATAAKYLKPVLLELGGKAPLIILDDADLEAAVDAAAFGAFLNQGQICMSTERIIVDEKVADAFAQKFVAKVKNLPCGDPRKGEVVFGAVVGMPTVERVHALVKEAVSRGAKVLLQGDAQGTVMPAVIVDHVTPAMQIFRDESFGPSVSITRFKTVEEAIRLANDTEYGLAAAVFGRDVARAFEVAKRIDSGMCHINAPTVHDEAQMPFGGVKASGYGRFGGKAAVEQFTELRWITIQTTPRHYPF
ncbi:MAG TPA: aldehyde dehydrogenase [Terriglobales bacterium]|nr:aldehyde dehydrogenase [Terriglobales bacterium]